MSHFGGGLGAGLGGGLRSRDPMDLSAGGVGIPSNLLISSGCLSLSGLNLMEGGRGGGGGGGGLVGLGGLIREAAGGLA